MAIKKLNPYLMFNGTAEKAIKLYETALGAKVETINRFGEVPGSTVAPENKNRIMHALLRVGEGTIMVSDCRPGETLAHGDEVHIALDFDDPEDMGRRFDALAVGGKVEMPIDNTFWGARFGMLVDAFGIQWMFNHDLKKA
jgi:PhnB protein